MAKISLRTYIHEIDSLIDKDQLEEAIAHCKYILKFFPKHIESYRLLGKAFLEDQRNTEALDIFERILAVIPDDFVSHIGMSIIREDDNNLDAAIWHMERAFEVQPSTTTIQEELKRLFTKRDGFVPPKTRFTKGALIRMYIRGELYTQAVSETRSVLSEDPLRTDLEILLGRTYFQMGQKDKALDVCSRIVEKMPFCFEANLILTDVLLSQGKSEPAKLFQQRLQALDPYNAYVNSSAQTAAQVPDIAIMIERLVWEPSTSDNIKPGWAAAIGVNLTNDQEAIPDWLISEVVDKNPTPENPVVQEPEMVIGISSNQTIELVSEQPEEISSPSGDEAIPDWLASAGWKESTEHIGENIETGKTSEELVQADIPDWLKEMKPQENEPLSTSEQGNNLSLSSEEMKSLKPENGLSTFPKGDTQPIKIYEKTQPVVLTTPTPEESKEDLTWLAMLAEPQDVVQNDIFYEPETDKSIKDDFSLSQLIEEKKEMGTPSPFEDLNVGLIPDSGISEALPVAQEIPLQDNFSLAAPGDENQNAELDSGFAWLEALAARQGADESTLLTKQGDRNENAPDWVTQPEVPSITPLETVSQLNNFSISSDNELPEWLIPGGDIHQPSIEAEQIETREKTTLPDWLIQASAQDIPHAENEKPELKDEETMPEWLIEVGAQKKGTDETIYTDFTLEKDLSTENFLPVDETLITPPMTSTSESVQINEEVTKSQDILGEKPEKDVSIPDWLSEEEHLAESSLNDEAEVVQLPPLPVWLQEVEPSKLDISSNIEGFQKGKTSDVKIKTDQIQPDILPELVNLVPESIPLLQVDNVEKTPPLPDWLQDIHEVNPVFTDHPVSGEVNLSPDPGPIISELPKETKQLFMTPPNGDETDDTGWVYESETNPVVDSAPIPAMPAGLLDITKVTQVSSQNGVPQKNQPEIISQTKRQEVEILSYQEVKKDLVKGDLKKALPQYLVLINSEQSLQEIVFDLEEAIHSHPVDIDLWQTLGDAYAKADRIQEALDAYTKAEDLLD